MLRRVRRSLRERPREVPLAGFQAMLRRLGKDYYTALISEFRSLDFKPC